MIVRGPRVECNFTILRNSTLRDARMSFKARGLMGFILSQEPGYRISAEELAAEGPDGRDSIRSGLREMEAAGYLVRERRRIGDGRITTDSVLYEVPRVAENPLLPETENPSSVRPAPTGETAGHTDDGSTGVGKPVALRRTVEEEELEEKNSPPAAGNRRVLLDGFEAFWQVYPRKTAKGAARRAWSKAVKAADGDSERIVNGAARFAADPNRSETFTPHASTWLNGERWDDPPLPARSTAERGVPRGWAGIAEARAMRGVGR